MAHSNVSTAPISRQARVLLPTTVGLDLSDRTSHYHVLRGDGAHLSSGKVLTQSAPLTKLFQQWKGCRLVIEAGGSSPWISRLAAECGMEVVVANPRRVELISKSDRKNSGASGDVFYRCVLVGPVAPAIAARDKQHGGRRDPRQEQ